MRKAYEEQLLRNKTNAEWNPRKYEKMASCHNCGEPNRILIVKKETKNKGRSFISCKECGSFRWVVPEC
jgi:transcription elongation factor Elf1